MLSYSHSVYKLVHEDLINIMTLVAFYILDFFKKYLINIKAKISYVLTICKFYIWKIKQSSIKYFKKFKITIKKNYIYKQKTQYV